ncbi:hypothetical protein B4U79_17964 [Dinothrombium tinctorium]|uniref:BPTI/Kunitz inhibitor domain-containing protein n=1 Tax=Dinothrombium tinctorium TaxID=1965070 RepID=A0A3S3Q403_9ACAR|nr:hypothetical protein B4U79_17964 [Dinothrombium tinctorium]
MKFVLFLAFLSLATIVLSHDHSGDHTHSANDNHQPQCHLTKSVTTCSSAPEAYYYDLTTHKCERYSASECAQNANTFPTKAACDTACGHGH